MNDNNSPFGFNSGNSFDPFDPFGLGSDSSSGFSTSSNQNQQSQSQQTSKDDSTSSDNSQKPTKDDGVKVKQVESTPASDNNNSGSSSGDGSDGVKVKDMSGDSPVSEKKEDKTPANFKIGGGVQDIKIKLKPHNLSFNEDYFLQLLAGSISLNRDEKKRILDSIPKLRQSQINELINIFEDERTKFAELPEKHKKELEKLDKKHANDWRSIEDEYLQVEKKAEDDNKAAELRKKLGL